MPKTPVSTWPALTDHQLISARAGLHTLGQRWTTWIIQTLHHQGPLPTLKLARSIPVPTHTALTDPLNRLRASGLIARMPGNVRSPYALTERGHAVAPIHAAAASWWRAHAADPAPTAQAEQVTQVLKTLATARTMNVLAFLGEAGPLPVTALYQRITSMGPSEATYPTHLYTTCQLAVADGLLSRDTHSRPARYRLTAAGSALQPLVTALVTWSTATSTTTAASPVNARIRARGNALPPPAWRPEDLFSHRTPPPPPFTVPSTSARR
ncbi:winged helix-turn-helix transcriptional regulator [Streptomyces carpaticus]|uniref:winged helix-turn-helix transcriptional regulator n=1 Tax=Streptomyces carpaticus TaxID=285558 RepID=UPI0031FA4875